MSASREAIVDSPESLSPLPLVLHRGLTAVAVLGSLSFVTTCCLFVGLACQLVTTRRTLNARIVQFLVLIFNLVWADIQQSVAFALNAVWVYQDAIQAESKTCLAQGW
jgi:hypothetical protein